MGIKLIKKFPLCDKCLSLNKNLASATPSYNPHNNEQDKNLKPPTHQRTNSKIPFPSKGSKDSLSENDFADNETKNLLTIKQKKKN